MKPFPESVAFKTRSGVSVKFSASTTENAGFLQHPTLNQSKNMDAVECASKCLLGLPIKSKAQIWFNWIIPIVLELLVYIVLIVADFAVTYQHFIDGNHLWAGLTLSFIWLPAILCFCSIIASPRNWPEYYSQSGEAGVCQQCLQFFLILIVNVLLFPVGAFIRYTA